MSLRFACLGAGFWAQYQLAAWRELNGVECVAICDPNRARAEMLARRFGIRPVYEDVEVLLESQSIDFVDIVSSVESHVPLALAAARHGLPAICQKPLAEDLKTARSLIHAFREIQKPLLVHENFRWQAPMRAMAVELASMRIGRVIRARLDFVSGFPVFENQPALKTASPFILMDLGTHILDLVRFLFGSVTSVYCRTQKVHQDIAGEDVATVMLICASGATVVANMAYAGTPLEREAFPQTQIFVEGELGSLELALDHCVRVTTAAGTHSARHAPTVYAWSDPAYTLVHASIVDCNRSLRDVLAGTDGESGVTTAVDNYETLRLVHAAYASARRGLPIQMEGKDAFGYLDQP